MNTLKVKADAGTIEVYEHQLYELTDTFIEERLMGNAAKLLSNRMSWVYYIRNRIQPPDHENIDLLDKIFDVYVQICAAYGIRPTVEQYALLIGSRRSTLDGWRIGQWRSSSHSDAVKKWTEICKSFVIDELTNSKQPNINLIFVSKACYGLRELAPYSPELPEKRALSAEELPNLSVEGEQ